MDAISDCASSSPRFGPLGATFCANATISRLSLSIKVPLRSSQRINEAMRASAAWPSALLGVFSANFIAASLNWNTNCIRRGTDRLVCLPTTGNALDGGGDVLQGLRQP